MGSAGGAAGSAETTHWRENTSATSATIRLGREQIKWNLAVKTRGEGPNGNVENAFAK